MLKWKQWVPLKYQQQKLKGWSFIIKVIYFSVQRNHIFFFASIQLHDAARRLYFFAANRFHYAANCSETTVHHLETQQLVSISSSCCTCSYSCSCSSSSYDYDYYYYYYYFRNCKSCVYNCDDLLSYNSSPRSSHIWFSYIRNFIIILSRVYNESIQWPTPSWLVSSMSKSAAPVSQWSRVPIPCKSFFFFFSGFLFATAKVASITSMIYFHIIPSPRALMSN